MKLDKSDALLLHSILFAYVNSNVSLEFVDVNHLEDLFERLQEYVTVNSSGSSEEPEEIEDDCCDSDDQEQEQEEDEEPEAELHVTCQSASELSPVEVTSPDGSKVTLEFEDVGEDATVDALVDDGNVIIDAISCVVLTNQNISLYDGEEWHDFQIKKAPKTWKRVFPHGKIVGFTGGEEE